MANINEMRFLFGNKTSDEFDVFLASSLGSISRSNSAEVRSIVTTKNIFDNTFHFHRVNYDEPLRFDIIIANIDGTYIDNFKARELKKWLLTNKRQWFQVDQDDMSDIQFYCIATSAELIDIGSYTGGMLIEFLCSDPWAWTGIKKKTYQTSSGTLTFNFYNTTDFDEYILSPIFKITPTSNGSISVKNNTTNVTLTINNCVTTEVITIDNKTDKIVSTNGRVLLDSWNKRTIDFIDGVNSVTLTGNFKLDIEYRLPVRVGG